MKYVLLISLLSIVVSSIIAGPIVIHWHGRYLQDSKGRWHCLVGGGKGCIGRRTPSTENGSDSNILMSIEEGSLVYQGNKWYLLVSKDVLTNSETAKFFTNDKVKYFKPTIQEEALAEIDPIKFKNKILVTNGLMYPTIMPKSKIGDNLIWLELKNPKIKDISK